MAIDRDKVLHSAQKLVDRKKYDKAIAEYQKIIAQDPKDARTLLKIGDLQSRLESFPEAIATYDRVAQFYAQQGFSLKAIAVYKQIRELIRKHVPHLADRYGHIVPRLAEIYTQLGLTTDALGAYDEVATRYQQAGRDRDAIDVFRKMVALDTKNPLPHLRLAEACCRVQAVDDAIDSFWTAAELLLAMDRPDDALKVIERILHFRSDPVYARAAGQLYLKKGGRENGMQALAKLQLAFQANPKDLETLSLLADAFTVIEQGEKALAVHKEMARIAREQGNTSLYHELLTHLKTVAPHDDQVLALEKMGAPTDAALPVDSEAPPSSLGPSLPDEDEETHDTTITGPPSSIPDDAVELDDEVELLDDEIESIAPPPPPPPSASASAPSAPPRARFPSRPPTANVNVPRHMMASAPDVEIVEEGVLIEEGTYAEEDFPAPSGSFDPVQHAHKAIIDAESFRRLGLYDKAIEALHIALEIDPNSIDIRHKLREILVEAGEREPAIIETINIATIHLYQHELDDAEDLLREILEIEPEHPTTWTLLEQVNAMRQAGPPLEAAPLPSYDLEGVDPSQAMAPAAPVDAEPLPSFPMGEIPDAPDAVSAESIEEVLEEAEFFASQGLFADAEAILEDQLTRSPGHPLLLERLDEVRQAHLDSPPSPSSPSPESVERPSDHAFDIAASLDALDGLTQPEAHQSMQHGAEEVDVDQVFEKFKEGVKAQVDESDAATHYDLGVAYKEMGLFPDARSEFELASRDPQRTCMCYAMIGLIHVQQGDLAAATGAYLRALDAEIKTPDQELSLHYDLGDTYQKRGEKAAALEHFQHIAAIKPTYRDVQNRIQTLGGNKQKPSSDDDEFDAAFDELFK